MMPRHLSLALATLALVASAPLAARAQYFDDQVSQRSAIGSPEGFALELRMGPYVPDGITDVYDDEGPLLAFELDVVILRIPYVGLLGVGAGLGWALYDADAISTPDGEVTQEELSFLVLPVSGLAVLRVDVLARELDIPFVITGKLGVDAVVWDSDKGATDEADGVTFGLRWGVGVALELDFFDRAAARSLDEEWGINHSYVFFELYGSEARGAPVVGDRTWAAGLAFVL